MTIEELRQAVDTLTIAFEECKSYGIARACASGKARLRDDTSVVTITDLKIVETSGRIAALVIEIPVSDVSVTRTRQPLAKLWGPPSETKAPDEDYALGLAMTQSLLVGMWYTRAGTVEVTLRVLRPDRRGSALQILFTDTTLLREWATARRAAIRRP